jgi:hypothetical protein
MAYGRILPDVAAMPSLLEPSKHSVATYPNLDGEQSKTACLPISTDRVCSDILAVNDASKILTIF